MVLDLLRRTHRWMGLVIALPVALQGLSGTVLAVADLLPDQQATLAQPRSAGAIVAAARSATGARATRYIAPSEPGTIARVEIDTKDSKHRILRIDPATLAIVGNEQAGGGLIGLVRSWHVQLLLAEYGGRSIVGWSGIGMLVMLLTAVPIWWPRRGRVKRALTADFRATGSVFHRRLHGAAGAWIIGVLTVLTITGIVMAFPRTARDLLGLEQRQPPRSRAVTQAPPVLATDVDRAIDLARQAVPDAEPRMVMLPPRPADAMRVVMYRAGEEGARNAIQVQVDYVAGGSVRAVDEPATRGPAEGLYRWMHDLHTGGIGWWWTILSSVAGLGLFLLSLTGFLTWWHRHRARRSLMPRRSVPEAENLSAR